MNHPRNTATLPLWKAGLGLALAGATIGVAATGAVFTDTESIGANTFSTGTVAISTTSSSPLVSFSTPKMLPGDSAAGNVVVKNSGNVEMRYAITSTTTENVLAAQLDLVVWAEAAETTVDGTCADQPPATTLYATGDLGSTTGTKLVGDPAQGAQTGDRTLTALAEEKLCFKVSLPLATGNTYQNLETTATFAFAAEQTKNNA